MKALLPGLLFILILSSCGSHIGTLSSDFINSDYQYADQAYGFSQTSGLGVIGGMSKDALVLEAKNNLMKNRPLSAGESYVNFTVDFTHKYFLVFKLKCTVTADVVKEKSLEEPIYSDLYFRKVLESPENVNIFMVNDTLVTKSQDYYVLKGFGRTGDFKVCHLKNEMSNLHKVVSKKSHHLFRPKGELYGYRIGDNIKFRKDTYKIEALGTESMLVSLGSSKSYYELEYYLINDFKNK